MIQTQLLETYTVPDYQTWEGDWELIYGQPLAMTPSPGVLHQRISSAIHAQLFSALEPCPSCEVLFEIDVEFTAETVVRPDLVVICYPAQGDRLTRAPELIVEVVSHLRSRRDEVIKFDLYQREGVAYYILAYPEVRKIKVYRLSENVYVKVGDFFDERLRFELSKCSFDFDFGSVWPKANPRS